MLQNYDVIVVGGGHAGNEAAAAAANMGCSTLLVTMNMNTIGQMSCNPAIGGIAKGQIVKEIDAMGGYTGIIADKSAIQYKLLNRSKGPAMWSPRSQNDRLRFAEEWRLTLEGIQGLDFWQDMVVGLVVENGKVVGVRTGMGVIIKGTTVILNSGTFLNGLIHLGLKNFGGGRAGDPASTGITKELIDLGFISGRMKTGTPPRVDGRTLDYSKMTVQPGDNNPGKFSYSELSKNLTEQLPCYMTYTNSEVHDVLKSGFDRSPMFNGSIQSVGPRYCPSIEDKLNRFSERDRHQIYVEPEGWNTVEIYVNGFSTSLPEEVQYEGLKLIAGFENVKMFRPGYAIEYDYFPPTQLKHTLETKLVKNLFFAGQINGTTGYEEAACQGLMAGINAALKCKNRDPLILTRDEAYIGVLIDDLITKGTDEPYRMFTSRAEYRILLRQDNADIRLTPLSFKLGLASKQRMEAVENKLNMTKDLISYFKKTSVSPTEINPLFAEKKSAVLTQKVKLYSLIKRPHVTLMDLAGCSAKILEKLTDYGGNVDSVVEQAEVQMKYSGYINKQGEQVEKMHRLEEVKIPKEINYNKFSALSSESKEKLNQIQPSTLGQASRISGIKPSDVSVLMVYLGR
ncbi:tRNA uridine-5-carboxymethylaminomethyl(34) synthesis enzyme MnmG [Flavobacteriales bacterium]|nr:tRNA uridine-5-carboxymethylaminomethyl(34) synthesis enzyme MnmG [Flavobacteriales bacterium]MDC3337215.1 tRNA uridine-5-carboxymethylaminomethyl(34) synthesis enzyme MnmG [Flavobacteriales bacterium]